MNGVLWTVEKGGVGRRRGARAEGFESAGTWKQPRPGWTVASGRKQQPLAFFPRSCSTLDETACLGVGRIPTQKPEGEGGGGLGLGFVGVELGRLLLAAPGLKMSSFLDRLCDESRPRFHQHPSAMATTNAVTVRVPIIVDRGCFKSGTQHRSPPTGRTLLYWSVDHVAC